MKQIIVETNAKSETINLTEKVNNLIDIDEGICLVFVPHTSCGITINETAGLEEDIPNTLSKLIPENAGYLHEGNIGNADSHIKASIIGSSITIPVENNRLSLGTWQNILFMEFDGPRKRQVIVQTIKK